MPIYESFLLEFNVCFSQGSKVMKLTSKDILVKANLTHNVANMQDNNIKYPKNIYKTHKKILHIKYRE